MRNPLLALLASLTFVALPAQADKHETFYYSLDNGLRIIVRPDHRAPVAVTQIWYQVGSSYEYEGITGISHMLEHLMFKGTPQYPEGEFVKIISDNGGVQNAFTSNDFTVYYEELESRRLPLAFALEADRMRNLVFNEEELITEKEIISEERRLRVEDNPVSRMFERFNTVANAASPYRTPVIGWMGDIQNINYEDIRNWYDIWYAPNNAILIVVGDVEPDTVYKLAQHYFGAIPASNRLPTQEIPSIKRPGEVPPLGERYVNINIPAILPYVYLGYNVPVANTANEAWEPYALDVLAGILDGGTSARLTKELVREQMIATEVGAAYNPFDRLDTILILGGIPGKDRTIFELEAALREQVQRLQNTLVSDEELTRIKNQVVAGEIFARDSLTQQALQMGSLASVGLSPELADQYVDNIKAVTAEQIQQVAQRYLLDERLTVGVLNPQPLNSP